MCRASAPDALERARDGRQTATSWEALGRPGVSAADAVAELIAGVRQPATLRAVGVKREQLPKSAEAAMHSIWVRKNPQPVRSSEDVLRIPEAAW